MFATCRPVIEVRPIIEGRPGRLRRGSVKGRLEDRGLGREWCQPVSSRRCAREGRLEGRGFGRANPVAHRQSRNERDGHWGLGRIIDV